MMKPLFKLVLKTVPRKPGVYILYWFHDNIPVKINRMLGVDEKGILYIGGTEKRGLDSRLRDLRISIEKAMGIRKGKGYPHTLGPSLIYTGLIDRITREDLYIYFKTFNEPETAINQKKLALLYYTRYYGEPPPLNLQVSREFSLILSLGEKSVSRLASQIDPDLKQALGL